MEICCGKTVTTPFCPSCGKNHFTEDPALGLLSNVLKNHRSAKTKLSGLKSRLDNLTDDLGGHQAVYLKKGIRTTEAKLARWLSHEKWIREQIKINETQ